MCTENQHFAALASSCCWSQVKCHRLFGIADIPRDPSQAMRPKITLNIPSNEVNSRGTRKVGTRMNCAPLNHKQCMSHQPRGCSTNAHSVYAGQSPNPLNSAAFTSTPALTTKMQSLLSIGGDQTTEDGVASLASRKKASCGTPLAV